MGTSTKYKTLNGTTGSYGNGDYSSYLPRGAQPGKWLPKTRPVLCKSGYHWCDGEQQLIWHLGEHIYLIEERGACVRGGDKAASEQIRLVRRLESWNEITQRLFAVDCARIAVNRYASDNQRELLHACLDVIIGYAEGFCDAAACAAACDAACDAACGAARGAVYDAAYAAAHAAACAAARDAARDAACGAARDAAYDAAYVAARDAQAALLARYLNGEQGPFVGEAA